MQREVLEENLVLNGHNLRLGAWFTATVDRIQECPRDKPVTVLERPSQSPEHLWRPEDDSAQMLPIQSDS